MRQYRAICFDFDYTLGDSTDSIVAGFQYGFAKLGHPIPDRETVAGPPHPRPGDGAGHHRLSAGGRLHPSHRG